MAFASPQENTPELPWPPETPDNSPALNPFSDKHINTVSWDLCGWEATQPLRPPNPQEKEVLQSTTRAKRQRMRTKQHRRNESEGSISSTEPRSRTDSELLLQKEQEGVNARELRRHWQETVLVGGNQRQNHSVNQREQPDGAQKCLVMPNWGSSDLIKIDQTSEDQIRIAEWSAKITPTQLHKEASNRPRSNTHTGQLTVLGQSEPSGSIDQLLNKVGADKASPSPPLRTSQVARIVRRVAARHQTCECGNLVSTDLRSCRRCGRKRPSEDKSFELPQWTNNGIGGAVELPSDGDRPSPLLQHRLVERDRLARPSCVVSSSVGSASRDYGTVPREYTPDATYRGAGAGAAHRERMQLYNEVWNSRTHPRDDRATPQAGGMVVGSGKERTRVPGSLESRVKSTRILQNSKKGARAGLGSKNLKLLAHNSHKKNDGRDPPTRTSFPALRGGERGVRGCVSSTRKEELQDANKGKGWGARKHPDAPVVKKKPGVDDWLEDGHGTQVVVTRPNKTSFLGARGTTNKSVAREDDRALNAGGRSFIRSQSEPPRRPEYSTYFPSVVS